MLTAKQIEVGGAKYVIGQVPADKAFDIGCIVLEWRGKIAEAAGSAAAASDVVARLADAIGDDRATSRVLTNYIAEQVAGYGRSQQTVAKMLRDREYRDTVFRPLFEVCSRDGQPVLGGDWLTYYAGERMADLIAVHNAAVDHNCAGFLRGFALATPNGAANPATSPADE